MVDVGFEGSNKVTVSGTVTADAGTDLNTSLLALEAGNLANIAGKIPTNPSTEDKQDLQPLAATTPIIYNVTMTNINTEYSQALPANTKIIEFRNQGVGFDTRYAYETGKVATPTAPYALLAAGEVKTVEGLNLTGKTLYFACGTAGQTLQLEVWT